MDEVNKFKKPAEKVHSSKQKFLITKGEWPFSFGEWIATKKKPSEEGSMTKLDFA